MVHTQSRPSLRSLAFVLFALVAAPPALAAQEGTLTPGEIVRLSIDRRAVRSLGLPQLWEGTFLMVDDDNFIGRDARREGVRVPLRAIETLDVRRARGSGHAIRRGAIGGTVFGLGTYFFLNILCGDACRGDSSSALVPALGAGVGFGLLIFAQGPGEDWVRMGVPTAGAGR